MFIEMLQLLLWTGSTSLSPVQTTVGDMEIASLECVSVIWDTQVMPKRWCRNQTLVFLQVSYILTVFLQWSRIVVSHR